MPARPRTSPRSTPQQFPSLDEEQSLAMQGYCRIAGVDEAGRGSWAGPLEASAVRLPAPNGTLLTLQDGVRDTKQLTAGRRCAVDVGLGVVSPATIDRIGLARAGEVSMLWAVEDMDRQPDCLLIDAFALRGCALHQRPVIHGDCISLSIAAASIVAKVARDLMMQAADAVFPGYGFQLHKGYGTDYHKKALERLGPCRYHRCSFEPIHAAGEMLI